MSVLAADLHAVSFPPGQTKNDSPVFTRNELFIAAPAEKIFAALVQAKQWPAFYDGAKNIEIEGTETLEQGTKFHWNTLGVRVHTKIVEFVPNRRLAWSGHGILGATAYHGWIIEPREGGCLVITEETQQGFLASISRYFLRDKLLKAHQRWLEGLARYAGAI